jgi:hypothetical protein
MVRIGCDPLFRLLRSLWATVAARQPSAAGACLLAMRQGESGCPPSEHTTQDQRLRFPTPAQPHGAKDLRNGSLMMGAEHERLPLPWVDGVSLVSLFS